MVHECVIFPNLNWLKFKKNRGDFTQNLAQNNFFVRLEYEWVIFSWKMVFLGSTFKIHGGTSQPNPNLSTPQPTRASCMLIHVLKCWPNRSYCHIIFTHSKWLKKQIQKVVNIPYNDDNDDLLCRFLVCSSMWWNRVKKLIKSCRKFPQSSKKVL